MNTRNGKIARLPHVIRERLNRRLQNGEPGKRLVAWLNSLPEVKAVLETEFSCRPVSEQNLSEWKQRGYREWVAGDVVRRLVEQSNQLGELADTAELSQRLATVLTVELAQQVQQLLAETSDPAERWRRLREAFDKLAQLRREESNAGRLRLEQEKWRSKQSEVKARGAVAQKLFLVNAALLQCGIHQLVAGASPMGQAVMIQTLELLTEKQRAASNDARPQTTAPLESNQANSRNSPSPNPTQSK
jgi:hypothetical protein